MNVDADRVIQRLMNRISQLEYEVAVKDAALEQMTELMNTEDQTEPNVVTDIEGAPA